LIQIKSEIAAPPSSACLLEEDGGFDSILCWVPDGVVEVGGGGGHSSAATVYERVRLARIPHVHRAVGITTDSKGRNFGVLQSDPKTRSGRHHHVGDFSLSLSLFIFTRFHFGAR